MGVPTFRTARVRASTKLSAAPRNTASRSRLCCQQRPWLVSRCVKRINASAAPKEATANSTGREAGPKAGYDVYAYEPQPLREGESKHVVSVFVMDESGLINRVSGVFARRGANIESLAVGLNIDKALFTIVATGTDATVATLVKQLGRLVKVRYVEDITQADRVERELILLKLRAPAGSARTEVLQLADIFRARVVDVSEAYLTICVSGDVGKITAILKVMSKFGIVEIARTGRIALRRGERLLETAAHGTDGVKQVAAKRTIPIDVGGLKNDVYAIESTDDGGVWNVENILEPGYLDPATLGEYKPYTFNIDVMDVAGVLQQVTGVFARRGYNIQSLAVGPCETPGYSRICMVVPGSPTGIQSLIKQVYKLATVRTVTDLTDGPFVQRELLLVKVRCPAASRGEVSNLVEIFRGNVIDVSANTVTIEVQGKESKFWPFVQLLEEYGVLEIARTGRVAMQRESGVDVPFLEKMSAGRVW